MTTTIEETTLEDARRRLAMDLPTSSMSARSIAVTTAWIRSPNRTLRALDKSSHDVEWTVADIGLQSGGLV